MRKFKPSPAMVVALLALIVALGGSAFATGYVITKSSQIKDGVITASDVKNGSLASSDIKDSSLTGTDVKDGSLVSRDFKAGQLPAGQQGPRGDQGPPGTQGSQGEVGPRGPSDLYTGFTETFTMAAYSDFFDLVAIHPPAGSYFVYANATVSNPTDDTLTLKCYISGSPGSLDPEYYADATELVLAPHEKGSISLSGSITLPGPGADSVYLDFFCLPQHPRPIGGNTVFSDADLGALRVGTLH
jgi:hypothetical protein